MPLEIWQNAASLARKHCNMASKSEAQLEGMISVRSDDLDDANRRLFDLSEKLHSTRSERDACLLRYENAVASMIQATQNDALVKSESLDTLKADLASCETYISALEEDIFSAKRQRDAELANYDGDIDELERNLAVVELTEKDLSSNHQVFISRLEIAKDSVARLETMWNVDLSAGLPEDFSLPSDCPTCHQPMKDLHEHENLESTVFHSLESALRERDSFRTEANAKAEALRKIQEQIKSLNERIEHLKGNKRKSILRWDVTIEEKENVVNTERHRQRSLSSKLSDFASTIDRDLQKASLEASLKEANEKLRYIQESVDSIESEVTKLQNSLFDLNAQRDHQSRTKLIMSELSQLFSPKGIQSFILKNTIVDLEAATQTILSEISDGTQKLNLSLEFGEGISRRAFVTGNGGDFVERPLGSLSGGQWRRCSLALNFGFAEVIARRGRFRCSLCILDEPLTHLDRSGRTDVGRLLRRFVRESHSESSASLGLSYETVLIILQDLAAEELEESFDSVDRVIKRRGVSSVTIDGGL